MQKYFILALYEGRWMKSFLNAKYPNGFEAKACFAVFLPYEISALCQPHRIETDGKMVENVWDTIRSKKAEQGEMK